MSMLLFMLHGLWSIIDDSGSVVSSVVSSHPTLLLFHMLTRKMGTRLDVTQTSVEESSDDCKPKNLHC